MATIILYIIVAFMFLVPKYTANYNSRGGGGRGHPNVIMHGIISVSISRKIHYKEQ